MVSCNETIVFAFFDNDISIEMKTKMCAAILRKNEASDTTDEIDDDENAEKRRKEKHKWKKRVELKLSASE